MGKGIIAKIVGVAVASFLGGTRFGIWLQKKKEVKFEVCTEEELDQAVSEESEQVEKIPEITRPVDIQKMIDRTFEHSSDAERDTDGDSNGLVQMDTQKEQYFQRWKAEEIADRYDTRTKDISYSEEGFDESFINEISQPEDQESETAAAGNGVIFEPATIEDWDKWAGVQDGTYDAIQVYWYDEDNVLTDDQHEPVENPEVWVGPDIESYFNTISIDTTDDPDVRVIYNHPKKVIYQISRIHANYGQKKKLEEFGSDDGDDRDDYIRSRY